MTVISNAPAAASPAPSAPATARTPAQVTRRELILVAVLVALHVPLAILMRTVTLVSTAHATACLVVGLIIATTTRNLRTVAIVVGYLSGAEVLWRMTRADVFWEYGKYAIVAVIAIALLRMHPRRNRALSITFFALLLPSIALTLAAEDIERAREDISFNLSGPLALTFCILFFSNLRITTHDLRRVGFAVIAPVCGIATLSYLSTTASEQIDFINASNLQTSGGFGPNQVSAILGLGVLFALLMMFDRGASLRIRIPLLVTALLLSVLSALTFSRGGILLAFASVFAAALWLVRGRARTRMTLIAVAALVFTVGKYAIEPKLEDFTQGKLAERYGSLSSSGRDKFVAFDLEVFVNNPVLGVGPGMVTPLREQEFGMFGASHTEYTRMLAEHGLLGAIAVLLLVVIAIRVVRGAHSVSARALTFAMITWVGLFLMLYGMRIAAPSFLFGLACAISNSSGEARR